MLRIIAKELQEMLASPVILIGLLVFPCLVLWAVANLPLNEDRIRIYVEDRSCNIADPQGRVSVRACALPTAAQVRQALGDLPGFSFVDAERGERSIWSFMDASGANAAFIWHENLLLDPEPRAAPAPPPVAAPQPAAVPAEGAQPETPQVRGGAPAVSAEGSGTGGSVCSDLSECPVEVIRVPRAGGAWFVYVDPPHQQSARLTEIMIRMAQANASVLALAARQGEDQYPVPSTGMAMIGIDAGVAIAQQYEVAAGQFVLISRDAPATNLKKFLVPGLMVLMACFVAFAIGTVSVVRELEQGTISYLVIGARAGWWGMVAAKTVWGAWFGLFSLLVMSVFAHVVLDISIKPGFWSAFGLQGLAMLTAAGQGVAISGMAESVRSALFVNAGYLVASILFGGVLIPLGGAGIGDWLGLAFPVAHAHQAWVDWMLRGDAWHSVQAAFLPLVALASIVLVAVTATAWTVMHRV